jgi:hypothetical protein
MPDRTAGPKARKGRTAFIAGYCLRRTLPFVLNPPGMDDNAAAGAIVFANFLVSAVGIVTGACGLAVVWLACRGSMKTTYIFIGLVLMLLALILFWPRRSQTPARGVEPEVPPEQPVATAASDSRVREDIQPQRTNDSSAAPRAARLTQGTLSAVATQAQAVELSNLSQRVSAQVNTKVEFYGKVVDEGGAPVEGVRVKAGLLIYPESYFKTNLLTDANGNFSLSNLTGATLFVHLSKLGYAEVAETNQNRFEYYAVPGAHGFSPDTNFPVIFHVRKLPVEQQ